MWLEEIGFVKSPYGKLDPYNIDMKYLSWNRPDLSVAKDALDNFVKDVLNQRKVAIKIFGPSGSGKTWFTRIIEKTINEKNKDTILIYTKIPKMEPIFQTVYRIAIENFLRSGLKKLGDEVRKKTKGTGLNSWKKVLKNEELAICFSEIFNEGTKTVLARKWLIGDKLSASELGKLSEKIVYSVDSDYERYQMLARMLRELLNTFPSVILTVDELENAPVKLAGQLGDGLRDILDEFSDKFALVCSFTAQKEEEWYDQGYPEALARRFDYVAQLDSLSEGALPEFLRRHHNLYRKGDFKVKDQLFPFDEIASSALLKLMPPVHHYPGYFLPNCEILARLAAEEGVKKINASFVKRNSTKLRFK